MAKLCRRLFPTLLEQEGILYNLIISNFAPSDNLYQDIITSDKEIEFKNYIYSLIDIKEEKIITNKTVKELMSDAGYDIYECHTEEDIQTFRKYYKSSEELCTFHGGRLNMHYVFFAVKKNVNDIRRENFENPERQDEYGTSVISIQFYKGAINTLSIKNRYNHRVKNPDATFSNNLENIIPGLTYAFENEYNLNINKPTNEILELDKYMLANGKYYKYNLEINNIYYCPNNIIIDNGKVIEYDHSRYILIDYFLLDLQEKEIMIYDDFLIEDSFINEFKNIKKIEVIKEVKNKIITITCLGLEKIIIEIDKFGNIIGLKDTNITVAEDYYLSFNESLKTLELPNLKIARNYFLSDNIFLSKVEMLNLVEIGDNFLANNKTIKKISLPNVTTISDNFLSENEKIEEINVPKLEKIGHNFLRKNKKLKK